MNRRLKSRSGITLIELMSAAVIVGIVAAMAAPRFQKASEKINFKAINRDITSTLRLARSSAIAEKRPYGMYFATGFQDGASILSYTLFRDVVGLADYSFADGDSVVSVDTLPIDFTMLETDLVNDAVIFQPNGSASFSGAGNIYGMAVTENLVAIVAQNILASTGRVKTYSNYY